MGDGTMERREPRRGRRIRHTDRIIQNRLRFLKGFGPDEWYELNAAEPHRLAKKHPWDCGRTKCLVCHFEKIYGLGGKKYKGRTRESLAKYYD